MSEKGKDSLALSSSFDSNTMRQVARASSTILVLSALVASCVAVLTMTADARPVVIVMAAGSAAIATSYLATSWAIRKHEQKHKRSRPPDIATTHPPREESDEEIR